MSGDPAEKQETISRLLVYQPDISSEGCLKLSPKVVENKKADIIYQALKKVFDVRNAERTGNLNIRNVVGNGIKTIRIASNLKTGQGGTNQNKYKPNTTANVAKTGHVGKDDVNKTTSVKKEQNDEQCEQNVEITMEKVDVNPETSVKEEKYEHLIENAETILEKDVNQKTSAKKEKKSVNKNRNRYEHLKKNAEIILKHSSLYPVKFQRATSEILCCFCTKSFTDPSLFRSHMDGDHNLVDKSSVINYRDEFQVRVDITDMHCLVCKSYFTTLKSLAEHLQEHDVGIDPLINLGLVPLKLVKDTHICVVCNKKCLTRFQLSKHSGTHFFQHMCDVCGKGYETKGGIKLHYQSQHLYCKTCKKQFPNAKAKRDHLTANKDCNKTSTTSKLTKTKHVDKDDPNKKKIAKRGSNDKRYEHLKKNAEIILRHSSVYPLKVRRTTSDILCCLCTDSFTDPSLFRSHMDTAHAAVDKSTIINYKDEFQVRVDITDMHCLLCKSYFTTLKSLAEHLVEHDVGIDLSINLGLVPLKLIKDTHICLVCNKQCITRFRLAKHSGSHFIQHICDVCGKGYETQGGIKIHYHSQHLYKHYCKVCKTRFPNAKAKRDHLTANKDCFEAKCKICNVRFRFWRLLQDHLIEVHNKPSKFSKEFVCDACGQVFDSRQRRYFHFKEAHTDDYKCNFCEKRFSMRQLLDEHTSRVHTAERPLQCDVCDARFYAKKTLRVHLITHDDSKKKACPVCGRLFVTTTKVKDHLQRHHPEYSKE